MSNDPRVQDGLTNTESESARKRHPIEVMLQDQRLIILILLLALVAGVSSLFVMPRMEDPVLLGRAALITTRMPGANAERVEALVSEKIEDKLRDIEEIKELRSVSRMGISSISVELLDSVKQTDAVWSRLRSRIEDALPELPPTASRPEFDEMRVRAFALIVGIAWNRDEPADIILLRRLAIELQDRLQGLPGTDLVERFGDPGEEISVELDPVAVAALGMTPADVAQRMEAFDSKSSAGQIRQDSLQLAVEVGNQFDLAEQIRAIPIRETADRYVSLADVATVTLGTPMPPTTGAQLDGCDAVVLGAMVRSSYRIDSWTEMADQEIAAFARELPAGIEIRSVLRQTDYVNQRLISLGGNLAMGAAAVSVVIWLLMGWRSAWIVTLTLPLTSLIVLFFMRVLSIPIHQMSITGLIISMGLLIDNAIVVVDEVKSRIAHGRPALVAAREVVLHLAAPLVGSTITTALAFAPIALMPGPAGEFVGSIAISVILAIFSSLFLAMTVVPAIAARFLKTSSTPKGRLRWFHDGLSFPRFTRGFRKVLRTLIGRPAIGVTLGVAAPIIGLMLFPTLREQFFPPSGRDQFHVTIEGPAISSLAETRRTAQRVEAGLRQHSVKQIDWFFGESAPQFYYNVLANRRGTRNFAQAIVTVDRDVEPTKLIRRLQRQFRNDIPSSRVLVRQLEQGPPFEAPVEVRLFGPDLQRLRNLGDEVRARLMSIPEVTFCRTDLSEVLPMVSIDVDEESARTAGLSPRDVADHFRFALEGRHGGSVLEENEEMPIQVRVADRDRGDMSRIAAMELISPSDHSSGPVAVPVSAIADWDLVPKSAAIVRLNRQRMNEVSAYIVAGVLPSEVQSAIETSLADDPLDLPSGYRLEYGGSASKRNDAVGNLLSTVGVLTTLMIATLVLSLGSFRLTAIIGCVAGLSVGLGMLALTVGGYAFGFTAIIGTMGLIGVAINDSIVVLAAINANPKAVEGDLDAIVSEVMGTSRHVVATTLTTMAGFAPLILSGGGFWPPMAVCIAGGVSGATLLALVFVPAIYRWTSPR